MQRAAACGQRARRSAAARVTSSSSQRGCRCNAIHGALLTDLQRRRQPLSSEITSLNTLKCSNRLQKASIRSSISNRTTATAAAGTVGQQAPASLPPVPAVKLDPEVKAKHTRPPGWQAPGPKPYGPGADPSLNPQEHETLSYLTGDWRIFQLKDGHRWSMDDMMTAYVALQEAAASNQAAAAAAAAAAEPAELAGLAAAGPAITHTLDIGCGIGSVLLMVAWGLRRQHMEQQQQQQQEQEQQQEQQARMQQQQLEQQQGMTNHNNQVTQQIQSTPQQQQQQQQQCEPLLAGFTVSSLGVEAQAISYQLAQRSIAYNLGPGGSSVQVVNQDLREALPHGPIYQLVTGTPPYIPQGSGGRSVKPQKAPCCLETRGGIEDYCQAAARALAPGGTFVVCGGIQGQPAGFKGRRAQNAAAAAGLVVVRQVTVVTREGKPPLFGVYVMKRAEDVLANKEHWHLKHHQQQQQQPSLEEQVASGHLDGCEELFVVRHVDGRHTSVWHEAREAMGLPPLKQQ